MRSTPRHVLGNKKRNPFVVLAARAGPGDRGRRHVTDRGQGTRAFLSRGLRAPNVLAAYTIVTLYPVLHWSEYTCLLSLTGPFGKF